MLNSPRVGGARIGTSAGGEAEAEDWDASEETGQAYTVVANACQPDDLSAMHKYLIVMETIAIIFRRKVKVGRE